jgi:hypothetical protein
VVFASSTGVAFDAIGALHPRWVSNALGLELLSGGVVTALGVVAGLMAWPGEPPSIDVEHLLTLARALFVASCAWMYLSFAPFLVVWMGDLPAGVSWYGPRVVGAWWWLAAVCVALRFVLPFAALLTDPLRRRRSVVWPTAVALIVTEPLTLAWLVLPSLSPDRAGSWWADLGTFVLAIAALALTADARTRNVAPVPSDELARITGYRAR